MVRPGGPAPAPPPVAGAPPARGRTGRSGRARPVPAGLAGRGRRSATTPRRRCAGRPPWSGSPRSSTSWPASRSRPRSSSATSCRRGSPATSRACSTSSARSARSPGSGGGASVATTAGSCWSGPGARSCGRPARPTASNRRPSRATRRSASTWPPAARRSTASCSRRPAAARTARSSTRCGTSSGPARSPTTPSRRCAPCAGSGPAAAARRNGGRPGRLTALGPPEAAGRWSLVAADADVGLGRPSGSTPEPGAARAARRPHPRGGRDRGDRGRVRGGLPDPARDGGSGRIRRGYFVDGLGAAQFALAGALDRLRAVREPADPPTTGAVHLLAAADPANPYGAALPWPRRGETDRRPLQRAAGRVRRARRRRRGAVPRARRRHAPDPAGGRRPGRGGRGGAGPGRPRRRRPGARARHPQGRRRGRRGVALPDRRCSRPGSWPATAASSLRAASARPDVPEGDTLFRTAAGLRPYLVGRTVIAALDRRARRRSPGRADRRARRSPRSRRSARTC